jgi:hypothetical protein
VVHGSEVGAERWRKSTASDLEYRLVHHNATNLQPLDNQSKAETMREMLKRLRSAYKACALLLLNTIVVYIVLNLALGGMFYVRDAFRGDSVPSKLQNPEKLRTVYPGLNDSEIESMLSENWNRPYIYSEFTHFTERPFNGRYVTVSPVGYRHSSNQGPWPPNSDDINIFVFGGSTTFGYGLPDWQTLPSHLQDGFSRGSARPVRVYNFGVGWYYSTQERILFEKLLFQGHVPDIAIFVDGLNDLPRGSDNKPAFNNQLAEVPSVSRDLARKPCQPGVVSIVWYAPVNKLRSAGCRQFAKSAHTRSPPDLVPDENTPM